MVVIPDRASQRNNFHIIPLSRPRIERERDCRGLARIAPRRAWLACRRSSTGASRVRRARRHRTVGGGHDPATAAVSHNAEAQSPSSSSTPAIIFGCRSGASRMAPWARYFSTLRSKTRPWTHLRLMSPSWSRCCCSTAPRPPRSATRYAVHLMVRRRVWSARSSTGSPRWAAPIMNFAQRIDFNALDGAGRACGCLASQTQKQGHEWRYRNRGSLVD